MGLECPNCRGPVSFWRSIRTTAWGRFPCKTCGSILSIDARRRFLAVIPLVGAIAVLLFVARVQDYGTLAFVAGYVAVAVPVFYFIEKVVIIERRRFCCRKCGYELEGLTEPRCPECAEPFDPAERQRVLERLGRPPPPARHRWVLVLLIVLFSATLAAALITHRWASPRPPATPTPARPTLGG